MQENNKITVSLTLDAEALRRVIQELYPESKLPSLPIKEEETLLRRKEVAKLFSVSLVTISQWMKSGKLPYHRINSRIFFKKSEVWSAMEINPKYRRAKK